MSNHEQWRRRTERCVLEAVLHAEDRIFTTYMAIDGWIWSFRPRSEMSDKDVENWMSEGTQFRYSIIIEGTT
jgi:hypothetical protein